MFRATVPRTRNYRTHTWMTEKLICYMSTKIFATIQYIVYNANKPKKRLSVHVWYTVITPRPVRETNTLQWYHSIKMPPGGHRRHHHPGAPNVTPGRPDRFQLRVPDLREGRADTTIWQCTEMTAPATAAERLTCHVRSILGRYKFREHIGVKLGTYHCPDL